jgi:hypothetical protein
VPALSPSDAAAVFELMEKVAAEHDFTAATAALEVGLGDMIAARVALVVVDDGGRIWSPRPPSLRGAAQTVGLGPVAAVARGEYSVITQSSVIVPIDANGDPGLALIAYRAPDAPPIDPRRSRIVASAAAHVAPIIRGLLDPDRRLIPPLPPRPRSRTRDDATIRVDPLTPPVLMPAVPRRGLADQIADKIVERLPRARVLIVAFALVIATAIGVCSPVGPAPASSATSGPGRGLPEVGAQR